MSRISFRVAYIILVRISDPFLNGGQAASGSSSSTGSSNGTPSHSYKGNIFKVEHHVLANLIRSLPILYYLHVCLIHNVLVIEKVDIVGGL